MKFVGVHRNYCRPAVTAGVYYRVFWTYSGPCGGAAGDRWPRKSDAPQSAYAAGQFWCCVSESNVAETREKGTSRRAYRPPSHMVVQPPFSRLPMCLSLSLRAVRPSSSLQQQRGCIAGGRPRFPSSRALLPYSNPHPRAHRHHHHHPPPPSGLLRSIGIFPSTAVRGLPVPSTVLPSPSAVSTHPSSLI